MRCTLPAAVLFAGSVLTAFAASAPQPTLWIHLQSEHFIVLTDSSERDARKTAAQFERMRAVFHTLIPTATADSGMPITVIALKDKKGFNALEPAAYLAKGQLTPMPTGRRPGLQRPQARSGDVASNHPSRCSAVRARA
jgi:hypothetical protein